MHTAGRGPGNAESAASVARTANLLGALALEATRAQEDATHAVVGQSGAAAAALVVIAAAPGRTIEQLRRPLNLSQPGATRLVDRLVQAGWVERGGPGGRRGLELRLTARGRQVLDDLLTARRRALVNLLGPLSEAQHAQLSELLETLLAARIHDRADLERVCRLCERRSCARCPVGHALDVILEAGRRR
jgi:MarR family transcriptional regulator, negative regulator of the multidrug operon emrRAB